MKKYLLLSVCMLSFFFAKAQTTLNFNIDFDTPIPDTNIIYFIDTVNNPNNVWQIGNSHKVFLTGSGKVLITDTLNPYPVNDTSYFNIKIWDHGLLNINEEYDGFSVEFYYKVDSDTLKDFGFFEFSRDNGQTWYFMNDSIYAYRWWGTGMEWHPFSGHHNIEWTGINFVDFGSWFINLPVIEDTIQLRFGFVSDSIFDNKEGLMISFIGISIATQVNVQEVTIDENFNIYPNPAGSIINIDVKNREKKYTLKIYDYVAKEVYSKEISYGNNNLNLSELSNGLYCFVFFDNDEKLIHTKKIQIIH